MNTNLYYIYLFIYMKKRYIIFPENLRFPNNNGSRHGILKNSGENSENPNFRQ